MFKALDVDQEDRSVSPVFVTDEDSGYTNKLNDMMDHCWDGVYACQKHKSQFIAAIQTDKNYTIEYTSTPFKNMIYTMRSESGQSKIKIRYPSSGIYAVYINGDKVEPTEWDKEAGENRELTGYKGCGENRYLGVSKTLEFIITAGCELEVNYVDGIVSNVRMEWTIDEFYGAGGVTSFIDRVSAALGIHASQMKVVAVYTGSVVVDYAIEPDSDSTDSA